MSSVVETPPDERVETLVEENTTTATYSQRQLIWRRFKKHRAGVIGGCVVIFLYLCVFLGEFLAPHDPAHRYYNYVHLPAQRIHIFSQDGIHWPFVYGIKKSFDLQTGIKNLYRKTPLCAIPCTPLREVPNTHSMASLPPTSTCLAPAKAIPCSSLAPTALGATCSRALSQGAASPSPLACSPYSSASPSALHSV